MARDFVFHGQAKVKFLIDSVQHVNGNGHSFWANAVAGDNDKFHGVFKLIFYRTVIPAHAGMTVHFNFQS
jgi:hypothetical protein